MANSSLRRSLAECASIIAERNQWLERRGISCEDYERFDAARNSLLDELIEGAEGREDPECTEEILGQIQSLFKDIYPSEPT